MNILGNAKKYLIIIENFEQAQTLNFAFYMFMPQIVEDDTVYELKYDVMNNNDEVLKTSKMTIKQEAPRYDIYEDDMIKANIEMEKEIAEVGEVIKTTINITNISGVDLNNMKIFLPIPDTFTFVHMNAYIDGQVAQNTYFTEQDEGMEILAIEIKNNSTITIELRTKVETYIKSSETMRAIIKYNEREVRNI